MTSLQDKIVNAFKWAMLNRPKVNGFPYLAEALRQAGVTRYVYELPSGQCIYFSTEGAVAAHTEALISGMVEVPRFNQDAFLKVLRTSQAGESTFPEFLKGTWDSGVVRYEADLLNRRVVYYGAHGESYSENFPAVEVKVT